ncbi:uncharacterized protein L203_105480 [Cryptococcus depauperatus CBS 7841]|uniref:Sec20 C-terminal domain-containing protein n=1 Tax=Cryptococcus depauperatus CBS 7841 TaxID=1295531 RepID=A0A1E3IEV3_9TREE|nr:hypothetical protein L203_04158 [Cryptococcus depauperatus CBS 7841]
MSPAATSAADLNPAIVRRLHDIRTFQLPRLQNFNGPQDMLNEMVEELRSDLRETKYKIDISKELVEFGLGDRRGVETLEVEHGELHVAFRRAMVDANKAIATRKSQSHDLALENVNPCDTEQTKAKGGNHQPKSAAELGIRGDDELQTKTNEVTTALRRTTALMQTELERSVLSVQMLETSTQTLTLTQVLHETYASLLSTSSQIVKTLQKADTLDRIVICAALFFFLVCVGWIIKRRILDRTVGVVLGGVGKGIGWYAVRSGQLVKMAFTGGRRGDLADVKFRGHDAEQDHSLPRIGTDSAVGDLDKDDYVPSSQVGARSYTDEEVEELQARREKGNVNSLSNDDTGHIEASWAADREIL